MPVRKKNLYRDFLRKRTNKSEMKYKAYKNKLTSILRFCEKRYYNELLEKNRNDIKETWKILNSITKRKKENPKFTDCFEINNKTIKDPKEIANGFNKFLLVLGQNLLRKLKVQMMLTFTNIWTI